MANSADPDQLASKKPTDLDLHCSQRQNKSGISRTRVKNLLSEMKGMQEKEFVIPKSVSRDHSLASAQQAS